MLKIALGGLLYIVIVCIGLFAICMTFVLVGAVSHWMNGKLCP